MFLNILNLSSVNIALPNIAADLGFSEATLPWVISAYALTFAGFLLVGGRVADLLGRRKVLAAGFATFGIFTLVDALATSPGVLITARGLQGVGAAITIPAALGLLTNTFSEEVERSRAVAAFAAAGAVGFACGLILGGIVTDELGWRWVFGLTVPPTAVLCALTFVLLAPDPAGGHSDGGIDLWGALTATLGLLGVVFALTNAAEAGWGAASTLVALMAGIALLALFLRLQARGREPLMPFAIWALPNFGSVMVIAFCMYAAWVGVNYFLALTLQNVLGYSPTEAAVALLPLAVVGLLGSTVAGRLLPRTGAKRMLITGLSLYIAGIVLVALIDGDSGYWFHIFAAVTLPVAGNSLTWVASSVTVLAEAAPDEQSLVGGMFNTSLQVGGGLGLAAMSAVAGTQIDLGASGDALLPAYHAALWAAVGIATVALLIALVFVRPSRSGAHKAPTRADGIVWPMAAMELIHTCYRIGEIDRSVSFYRALGFEERRRMDLPDGAINVFMGLPGDGDRLELTNNPGVDSYELGTGYNHVAVTVGQLDAMLEALEAQGIVPEKVPYRVGEHGSRICFIRDPDGYRIELIERAQ